LNLSISAYFNGISAIGVVVAAGVLGVGFLAKYIHEKKKLLPYVSIMGFSFVAFYLGPFTTFWSLVLYGVNINPILYTQLSYTVAPICVSDVMWLGFSIFNPDRKKIATGIFLLTIIPFYIFLFGFPSTQVLTNNIQPGDMLDIAFSPTIPVLLGLMGLYIVAAVFVLGGGFISLQRRISGVDKQRAIFVAIGLFCFGAGGSFEVLIASDYVVVARILIVIFLVFSYLGYRPISKLEQRTPHAVEPKINDEDRDEAGGNR
jgi:hypothetical protein